MHADPDLLFARRALELGVLSHEQLIAAVADWGAAGRRQALRAALVREGLLSEDQAIAVARSLRDPVGGTGFSSPRYRIGPELGRGANGLVHSALDRALGRSVALKTHNKGKVVDPIELQRFTHEAQVTGQLAHPGVVPVHDLGVLPDGRVYYTMKQIEGLSLRQVLSDLRRGGPETVGHWSPTRIAVVLLRVAQALAFAHDRGVVHRDVKPANIMVGDYGEVLLLDWGVARVLGTSEAGCAPVSTWRWEEGEDRTLAGTVAGTPAYMPPEQATGAIDAIGPASDVYAVGAVLYEFLAGSRPFRGKQVREVLDKVIHDTLEPPSRRNPEAAIPAELEAICLRCLRKPPEQRFANGRALAAALEGFLDGSRRREEAERLARRGLANSGAYVQAAEAASSAEERMRARRDGLAPWAPAERRRRVWEAEREHQELRRLRDDTYDDAVSLLQAALEREPDHPRARAGLAGLFLRRMEEAEARGDRGAARHFRRQALHYDDGMLKRVLLGPSRLAVRTDPPGARVTAARLIERDRVLVPIEPRDLGRTPVEGISLEPGSWVIDVEHEGRLPLRAALRIDRPQEHVLELRLRAPEEVTEGFVVVPGTRFPAGGDPQAWPGSPLRHVEVADFAIGRCPVTLAELHAWLRELGDTDEHTVWTGPEDLSPAERARLPALGVGRATAESYAAWLSDRLGRRFRLPTEDEWELAARGVDGRPLPWGRSWEPAFCNSLDGAEGLARPTPVGTHPADTSVFGLTDLAGGVHEWVLGEVPHRPDRGLLRGGAWNGHPALARICSHQSLPRTTRSGAVGFRLVQELDPDPRL